MFRQDPINFTKPIFGVYYDANGQVMATYNITLSTSDNIATLDEQHIYGAARLGMRKPNILLYDNAPISYAPSDVTQNTLGETYFEISNYLGNVNAVITDRKTVAGGGTSSFLAVVVSTADYYPFGMEMPGRSTNSGTYKYGYNGMEIDKEVSGNGNSYTTEFRQYDPKLGRWKSLDPLMAKYPHQSAYAAFNNNPIMYADPTGLEGENPNEGKEVEGIEAQDNISWNYGSEMPSMPQSYKNGPDVTTYNWDKIYDNFDQDGEGILNREKCLSDLANKETNTCAIKLSNALNKSGYDIPKSEETPADVRIRTGKKGDSGNFVLDAASMANYLTDIEKPTETYTIQTSEGIDAMISNIHDNYDDMYGIIVYVADQPGAYGATGHADLIYEDWGWDLAFSKGTEIGPYLKENVLPYTTFKVYIWVMGHD